MDDLFDRLGNSGNALVDRIQINFWTQPFREYSINTHTHTHRYILDFHFYKELASNHTTRILLVSPESAQEEAPVLPWSMSF